MKETGMDKFNYVSNSVYLVYCNGMKIAESDKFSDIKGYLYNEDEND